jgi:phage shock protein C
MEDVMITRNMKNRQLFGVCSGLARELEVDPVWVRLGFVVATLTGFGTPILLYVILALIMPKEET